MKDRDPNIIVSGRSQTFSKDGITVDVRIYRLEDEPKWLLEVVNEDGSSIVWDDLFDTDDEAFMAFEEAVEEDGMTTFLDDDVPTLH
jgi:hypothetical protein